MYCSCLNFINEYHDEILEILLNTIENWKNTNFDKPINNNCKTYFIGHTVSKTVIGFDNILFITNKIQKETNNENLFGFELAKFDSDLNNWILKDSDILDINIYIKNKVKHYDKLV